jgi:hypothetical protein
MLIVFGLAAAIPPLMEPPAPPFPCAETVIAAPSAVPPPQQRTGGRSAAPYGDTLGDAWEIEEVSCWRGIWTPRAGSRTWDGYWVHPGGERVRATLDLWQTGKSVTMVRRHERGQYCRYDGTISPDWWSIEGRYTCTWERTPMRWRATIVRTEYAMPALLRPPGSRHPRP